MQLAIEFNELPSNFPYPKMLARKSDPSTSKAAAARSVKFSGDHCQIIFDCLKQFGPQTADEIAKRTPLNSVQICRRLPELSREGYAMPTGAVRPSASGRMERVWMAR